MLVSMIVPIYNTGREMLTRCIDSLLGQTYRELELILVDDGSTDESGAVCDEYAQKDSRVVVIHKKNGGEGTARNAGLKRASGVYVGFSDSDDEWLPNGVQQLVDAFSADDEADMVVGAYLMKTGDKTRIFVADYEKYTPAEAELKGALKTEFTGEKFILSALNAKLFRMSIMKEIIRENGLLPYEQTRVSGDCILMRDYLLKVRTIKNIFLPIYVYYRDENVRVQGSFWLYPDNFIWYALFYQKQLEVIRLEDADSKALCSVHHNMVNEMIGALIKAAAYEDMFPYALREKIEWLINSELMTTIIPHYDPSKGKNPSIDIYEGMKNRDIDALMEALRRRAEKYLQKHGKTELVRLLYRPEQEIVK